MEDMFQETMMQKRTSTIIDLAQVEKGENVLILCDYHTANLGKLLTAQVFQRNAVPLFTIIPPLKAHADPVPEPVYKMAMEADVIIAPMTVSIGHTPLRHEALKKGKKLMDTLSATMNRGLVKACHDLSEGGIGVAAAEMA